MQVNGLENDKTDPEEANQAKYISGNFEMFRLTMDKIKDKITSKQGI